MYQLWNLCVDNLNPPRNWPRSITRILLSDTRPNNSQRYALICFVYGNLKIDPDVIIDYILNDWPDLDADAIRSMRKTARDIRAGIKNNCSYFNVYSQRSRDIYDQ